MTKTHDVLIDFDPLRIALPGAGPFVGTVKIVLPEVHAKLVDLSMGMHLLQGAHIGSDGRLWSLDIKDIQEPGMEAGDLLKFIASAEGELREMHRLIQEEMDKRYLLDDPP